MWGVANFWPSANNIYFLISAAENATWLENINEILHYAILKQLSTVSSVQIYKKVDLWFIHNSRD
jgi:hypothetical protein